MRWMAAALALLVAGVVLAGCSQPKADADVAGPTKAPGKDRQSRPGHGGRGGSDDDKRETDLDNATLRHFAEEFDLSVTALSSLLGFGSFDGRACVAVEGAPFKVVGGNATLTWSAQSPLAERLSLVTRQVYGDYYYDETPGASPLEVRIPELPEAETGRNSYDDSWFTFSVDAGDLDTVAVQQDVHLALSLDYLANDDVSSATGC